MKRSVARAITAEVGGRDPPETVTLFPAGTLETTDSRAPWVLDDAAAVVAASPPEIVIDFGHGSAAGRGGSDEAAGWARPEVGPDGEVAAPVSWTPAGAQAIKERRWRYLSPEFSYNATTRQILSIQAAALVNRPGLKYQAERALAAEDVGDLVAALAVRLGLPADADAAEIGAVLDDARKAEAQALGLADDADTAEIAAAKAALAAAGIDAGGAAERAVGEGVAAGHIAPWQRPAATALAMADPAAFAAFCGAAEPRFAYLSRPAAPAGRPAAGAGAAVEEVAARFKTTPAALIEARRQLGDPSR